MPCIFLEDTIGQVHEFESLPVDVGGEEATDEPVSDGNFPRLPPTITAATPASPGTTRATSAHHLRTRLRSCEKKTDLYILQPERLNTSGQSNPLKGKLTNCHDTGCERYVRYIYLNACSNDEKSTSFIDLKRSSNDNNGKNLNHALDRLIVVILHLQAIQRAKDSPHELDFAGSRHVVPMRKQTIEHRAYRGSDRTRCLYREKGTFVSS